MGQPGMGSLRTIRTRSAPARGRLPTALGDLTGTSEILLLAHYGRVGKGLKGNALTVHALQDCMRPRQIHVMQAAAGKWHASPLEGCARSCTVLAQFVGS